jgi:hypothetical protein
LEGETGSYLITQQPGLYHVEVIIEGCSMVSNEKEVVPTNDIFDYERPEIASTHNGVICDDKSVILSIDNLDQYDNASYQWFFNGNLIGGATGVTYETTEPGDYHVEVIIEDCSMVSDVFTVIYKETCGVTLLGTVFPFVRYEDNIPFSELFTITASLKAIPENPEEFDPTELLAADPLYGPVDAIYYDGTTFVPNTPSIPGSLGLLNNYGVPIDFQRAIGYPHIIPAMEFLGDKEPAVILGNMTIGLYQIDEVEAGDYILELKRDGYVARWAKVTVDSDIQMNYLDHRELIPGDVNADLAVNNNDINAIVENFNAVYFSPTQYRPMTRYDLDADGRVVNNDLNLLIIYAGFKYYHYLDTKEWLDELGIDY